MRSARHVPLPRIPGYELEALVGKGSSGRVWRARRARDGLPVALKQLAPDRLQAGDERARFRREAELLLAAPHPCLVPLLAVDLDADPPFLVFAFMAGGDLAARMHRPPRLAPGEVAAQGARVGAALAHLHGKGIVHRDVKPGNVLLDGAGRAFLGDLGLSKGAGAHGVTASGTALGTWEYMAPEVRDGRPARPASDLYSLAAMLVELLVGEPPSRTLAGVVVPPALARSGLPARLLVELRQCLRSAPEDRPASVSPLVGALEEAT